MSQVPGEAPWAEMVIFEIMENILLEKTSPKEMTLQQSPRIVVEKYQYRNPAGTEHNKCIFPY